VKVEVESCSGTSKLVSRKVIRRAAVLEIGRVVCRGRASPDGDDDSSEDNGEGGGREGKRKTLMQKNDGFVAVAIVCARGITRWRVHARFAKGLLSLCASGGEREGGAGKKREEKAKKRRSEKRLDGDDDDDDDDAVANEDGALSKCR
jgi:hypothetical protein